MSEESLAAILAEMRSANTQPAFYQRAIDKYADRIEAAAKRERAEAKDYFAKLHDGPSMICTAKNCAVRNVGLSLAAPGNAAAMREALERIVGWCEGCHADACEKVCRPELTSESIHAARRVLAAPARNCDLLDANGAWKGFLARGNNAEISASYQTGANAAIRWLYAAAEGCAK